jgi:flagellar basal body-associated protein FliL
MNAKKQDGGSSDEVISLEDLMRDDSASSPSGSAEVYSAAASELATPPPVAETSEPEAEAEAKRPSKSSNNEFSSEAEQALAELDPDFANSINDLNDDGFDPDGAVIDSLDLSATLHELGKSGWRRLLQFIIHAPKALAISTYYGLIDFFKYLRDSGKAGLKTALKGLLHGLTASLQSVLKGLKSAVKTILGLPLLSKLMSAAILALGIALYFVIRITFRGEFMPTFGPGIFISFETVADQKFTYDPDEALEHFNNPMLQPENVILIERIIVNLRRPGDGLNPMGLFELYVETASQEAAVEIKDREPEVRDVIARTFEQALYDDLTGIEGKNKIKLIIQKNLNTFLTKGRVRKVFFKTFVLKP